MLRPYQSPLANMNTAIHVYAMYSWISRHTGEPCHELTRIVPKAGECIAKTVERTKSFPVVKLQKDTVTAKLCEIYLEQPDEPDYSVL